MLTLDAMPTAVFVARCVSNNAIKADRPFEITLETSADVTRNVRDLRADRVCVMVIQLGEGEHRPLEDDVALHPADRLLRRDVAREGVVAVTQSVIAVVVRHVRVGERAPATVRRNRDSGKSRRKCKVAFTRSPRRRRLPSDTHPESSSLT